jgi:copper chaperone CopZ
MKITYKIEELDCAHCAAKIESEISKIAGVEKANVNYLSEKIIIITSDDIPGLFDKVKAIAEKTEPGCIVSL